MEITVIKASTIYTRPTKVSVTVQDLIQGFVVREGRGHMADL
jgi:hypothetical protein